MAVNMKVSGKITIWRVKESTSGTMAESMKDNIRMTRNMGLVFTPGLMVDVMKGIGGKENNTDLEHMLCQKTIN